ncbi:HAD-IIIA family hydrolase [Terrimonas sp. NA20]|uniref:HAD-IIIA family hydrolase n=1 Tax=Terrimonas ginsenosidimutans TaxID=2908004 RepID=A0ABS9KLK0_9BACT|nr:HAD-IIIA family hydrolase [Terrimonas ginsenosidimutans]MCG2613190.1 HAD-IIIA family hydrolase [Terrimonas ginsenosidimutans]
MIQQAIILAGGLGTRLREAVPDLPKCMAPVAGRPFIYHVINFLQQQGITSFIFSLGYKHEVIEQYLKDEFPALKYECVIETEPLGTGGAIQLACKHATEKQVLVTNGDTLFKIDIAQLSAFHQSKNSECTLALKPMQNFDRYGMVAVNNHGIVESFKEKQFYKEGLINGGTYLLNVDAFLAHGFPLKFSFEKDYLEKSTSTGKLAALAQDAYFIDIGIPEDFNRAQNELKHRNLQLSDIDKNWTLFLDRDGVINEDKPGSYIFSTDEFVFMEGGPELFKTLAERFKYIVVATNQRGVGRGLMTEDTLKEIHHKMKTAIVNAGGKLDAIYYATSIHNNDQFRKPNPGMGLQAKKDLSNVDLHRSVMIGNNVSDMQFGRAAGMYTVFLTTTNKEIRLPHPDIDLIFNSLKDFVKALAETA